ncbi:hypothetical protein [Hymenobacter psychrophilus]|uniref:Uncharacterized protein n=1 Tax=Hymenobacter psychrophilus TaxID=651662 RepID=A0A1H3PA26_9BACT|nr:hypothetical protein [Hymenobacter psychrophilus]SDY97947.1 hypothetical protein SAMN04488069_1264 [Hymenobacter psychrophilus]
MLAKHKKRLAAVWDKLGEIQAEVTAVAAEHAEYMDARSEKWHESDAGEQFDMDQGELETMESSLEEVVAALDNLIH